VPIGRLSALPQKAHDLVRANRTLGGANPDNPVMQALRRHGFAHVVNNYFLNVSASRISGRRGRLRAGRSPLFRGM
jgi:hypothetical protein